MEPKDYITAIALVVGPISAVIITLCYQRRAEKRAAKERLFAVLMAHRQSNPPTIEWANALNLIDVVFEDHRAVVSKWHELYDALNQPVAQINWLRVGHLRIELMSDMAVALRYRHLSQVEIDRFYAPQAHGDQAALNTDLQKELLRVLKATQTLKAIGD